MTGALRSRTDRFEGVAPGYTPVLFFTPTQVVVMASGISVLIASWALGRTRPETEEMARKAVSVWKCIV